MLLAALFVFFAAFGWILSAFGPFAFADKSTLLFFPLYSGTLKAEEKNRINALVSNHLKRGSYILLDTNMAESKLADKNIDYNGLVSRPSLEKYLDAALVVKAEKIAMGYILKTSAGIEIFARLIDVKFNTVTREAKYQASTLEKLESGLIPFASNLLTPTKGFSISQAVYYPLLALCGAYGALLSLFSIIKKMRSFVVPLLARGSEILIVAISSAFVISLIYGLNANMDYVRRFIASGGNIHLALDAAAETVNVFARYIPLLGLSALIYCRVRLRHGPASREVLGKSLIERWALPIVISSALFYAISFPSFIASDGFGLIAFVALVPLFTVLYSIKSLSWRVFYGISFGVLSTILINYWLGTFDLISLFFITIVFTVYYAVFMVASIFLLKNVTFGRFLVMPCAWVIFTFLHSNWFLGYPWGLPGASIYQFLPLIQIASITGIWGVSFLVLLVNSALAWSVTRWLSRERGKVFGAVAALSTLLVCAGFGVARMESYAGDIAKAKAEKTLRTVRVALIQENMDPRKHESEKVFETIKRLTDKALENKPGLVVWSEGAFDWYIREYLEDPNTEKTKSRELIRSFLDYQKSMGTWLLTGIFDHSYRDDIKSPENERRHNAAMLFSPSGKIEGTYYKIHLVPFTEYFPYKKELPWIDKLLEDFDIRHWDPGIERVIFEYTGMRFFTPICFEDVFPGECRDFVLKGAEAIVNITNDYWSLAEAEAKQHAIHALFRAVENGRPMLRATAGGFTCYVNSIGAIEKSMPCYEEGFVIADVNLLSGGNTLYTLFGDWFPFAAGAALSLLLIFSVMRKHIAVGKNKKAKT